MYKSFRQCYKRINDTRILWNIFFNPKSIDLMALPPSPLVQFDTNTYLNPCSTTMFTLVSSLPTIKNGTRRICKKTSTFIIILFKEKELQSEKSVYVLWYCKNIFTNFL